MEKADEKPDDEEISIDFGKVKSFFKRHKEKKEKKSPDVQESEGEGAEAVAGHEPENQEEPEEPIHEETESAAPSHDRQEKETEESHRHKPHKPEGEDEIVFDTSKITKLFRREKKPEAKGHAKAESDGAAKKGKDDDEVAIDFTKIKGFFKRRKDESSEDEAFDWRRISRFFLKYKVLFLILLPLILSMHFRLTATDLPITDDWARSSVNNYLKSQVQQEIDQQYPNLPDANKQQLVNSELQKALEQQKAEVAQQIQATSQYFKAQLQDEHGHTYLPDIDTYFWLRLAKNVVSHGYPGDKIVNGKQIDDHMIAPLGREMPQDVFHSYLMAYSYNFLHVFDNSLELDRVCFFMPVVFSALSIIPAFFLARRFGGNFAGFVAAMIVAIHPAFLVRSAAGVCDTDSYNVFFPVFITWLFFEAFVSHRLRWMLGLSAAAGFLVGLYSFTWGGWWFIPDFIFAASALYLAYYVLVHRQALRKSIRSFLATPTVKDSLIVIAVFFFASLIFVTAFRDFATFRISILGGPRSFSMIKDVATYTVWPNVFTTVAEQNEVDFKGIISNGGGTFLFCVAIFGILVSAFTKARDGKYDPKLSILLAIWLVATVYASTKGVRWVLLLVPAMGVAVGVASGFVYRVVAKYLTKEFGVNRIISEVMVILLILVLIFIYPQNMVSAADNIAKQDIPLINDAWVTSLQMINQNASKNAIINSWWDYGHWFKEIADRPVTFDGTSQDSPMAHWIGKALLTDDEDLAVGLLRMLDCGSNKAFEELDKVINKPYRTVEILYDVVSTDTENASQILKGYGLTSDQINIVLYYTHCEPPEDYFIASEDMISKSGVWAHFGSWDFRRSTIFNKVRLMDLQSGIDYLKTEFNYSNDDARNLYFQVKGLDPQRQANDWIAPWPSYASNLDACSAKDSIVQCNNGLQVDLRTYDAYILTQQGKKHPEELVVPSGDGLLRKKFANDTIPYSAALIPTGSGYESVMMQPQLSASMFTRLFFMQGQGLRHFKLLTYQRSALGTEVYVYTLDWKGGPPIVMEAVKQQLEAGKELHLRHILVNSSEEAETILERLKEGEDFAALAANYSTDASAANGGDIGWIRKGQTIEPFQTAAFNLTVGQISGVVKTAAGYHVIQLLGQRNQSIP